MEQTSDGTLMCSWRPHDVFHVPNRAETSGIKTIMCSVLFLDIAEYSQKSVSGQMVLKDRFNAFLAAAICDVPVDDRIILDTGDGAAVNFLGDVEDAIKSALILRDNLLNKGVRMEPQLHVRMGINLGPVRLVKDINDQPNIVGDGINVAQRIMAFSEPGQILVSRSYFDAVSHLSHESADMFHYLGVHTDKHLREHEIYSIGQADEITMAKLSGQIIDNHAEIRNPLKFAKHEIKNFLATFKNASNRQRALYVGIIASALALLTVVTVKIVHRPIEPLLETANNVQGASGVAEIASIPLVTNRTSTGQAINHTTTELASTQTKTAPSGHGKYSIQLSSSRNKADSPARNNNAIETPVKEIQTKETAKNEITSKENVPKTANDSKPATIIAISIAVAPWGEVYLDGKIQGISPPLNVLHVTPGLHDIEFRNTTFTPYLTTIQAKADQPIKIKHKFAN